MTGDLPLVLIDPAPRTRAMILSDEALRELEERISEMMMEDVRLILAGLPPVRLQRAEPRRAAMMRSR